MAPASHLAERVRPFLKNSTFLGGLPDAALNALMRRGHIKKYAKGDVVCRRDEPGDSLMLVLGGRLKITNVNADGREVVLNSRVRRPQWRDRCARRQGTHRQCHCHRGHRSLCRLWARPAAHHHRPPPGHARDRANSLPKAAGGLGDHRGQHAGDAVPCSQGPAELAQQLGRTSKEGIRLDLGVSQTELGNYLSLSRANVSRQLGQLKDAKVLKNSRRANRHRRRQGPVRDRRSGSFKAIVGSPDPLKVALGHARKLPGAQGPLPVRNCTGLK